MTSEYQRVGRVHQDSVSILLDSVPPSSQTPGTFRRRDVKNPSSGRGREDLIGQDTGTVSRGGDGVKTPTRDSVLC